MGNYFTKASASAIVDGENRRDWSSLPLDLVSKIADMLPVRYRANMRCVCSSWCSTIPPQRLPSPWLLLPGLLENNDQSKTSCTFFSVSENKSFVSGYLSSLDGKRCVGSSAGCLVLADDCGMDITVWNTRNDFALHTINTVHPGTNPGKKYERNICLETYRSPRVPSTSTDMPEWIITAEFKTKLTVLDPSMGVTFQLPSYTNFQHPYTNDPLIEVRPRNLDQYDNNIDYMYRINKYKQYFYVEKVVISSNTPSDFIAIAILYRESLKKHNVAYVRAGDKQWTFFDTEMEYDDIVYHYGKFYGLAVDLARVNAFDFTMTRPTITMIFKGDTEDNLFLFRKNLDFPPSWGYQNLVLSATGEMFLISRCQELCSNTSSPNHGKRCTIKITVLKCNSLNSGRWDKVDDIKGQSFFIGNNNSISVSCTDVPGLKSNCIYFTDTFEFECFEDIDEWQGDVGMFNMETQSFESVGPPNARMNWPSPIWFEPS